MLPAWGSAPRAGAPGRRGGSEWPWAGAGAHADGDRQPSGEVPPHLRDGHYRGAAQLGHGTGYRYPHDEASGWVEQRYRPEHLERRQYYRPSPHGQEATWRAWWPAPRDARDPE